MSFVGGSDHCAFFIYRIERLPIQTLSFKYDQFLVKDATFFEVSARNISKIKSRNLNLETLAAIE